LLARSARQFAEDAVSEPRLRRCPSHKVSATAQLKTWLVGILKHKVIGLIRINARTVATADSSSTKMLGWWDRLQFKAGTYRVTQ
jgi:RNA polymerase sigma-70 factor (ECF subfamily)